MNNFTETEIRSMIKEELIKLLTTHLFVDTDIDPGDSYSSPSVTVNMRLNIDGKEYKIC